jgi:inhibitor of cysteine peptidase
VIVLDEAASGRTFDLRIGQVIELRLKQNPGTGFAWQVAQSGAPACRIAEDRFVPPSPASPGRPGTRVWRIEGVAAGICALAFAYARAWETGVPPASTYTLTVRVGG